jgi:hypothetical protein
MSKFDTVSVAMHSPDLHARLRVAVAHVRVLPEEIEASYLGTPVITRTRLKRLNHLLNSLVQSGSKLKMHIDLVVLPEVSIPFSWRPILVSWCRQHQIGLVCGLEHRIARRKCALNEILIVLPYKSKNGEKACLPLRRLKRLYSPEETFLLENNHLEVPEKHADIYPQQKYHLIHWRGASFAVYNCYEFASIEDRALFKGKVDFIVCCEFNRDVNYFSNIAEAASRDLHCFIIQANDSQFGDSRVITPCETIQMNPLRIKGGDNTTFLTMEIDLASLRSHQRKKYGLQKESKLFKPTPPGLRIKDVMARIRLGGK